MRRSLRMRRARRKTRIVRIDAELRETDLHLSEVPEAAPQSFRERQLRIPQMSRTTEETTWPES